MDTSFYFEHVVENMDSQEIQVLQIHSNENANAKYRSMHNTKLMIKSGLTEARFRTIITRLNAFRFVDVNTSYKVHSVIINRYGQKALNFLRHN